MIWVGPPAFAENHILSVGSKIFHPQSHSFIRLGLPWKFEPNPSRLNFWLIWAVPPPHFLPKSEFWMRGGKIFHPQSHFYDGLGLPWKFGLILFSRSWDIKLSPGRGRARARDGTGTGRHTLWLYRKPQPKLLLDLAWLWLGLRLRFVNKSLYVFYIKCNYAIWSYFVNSFLKCHGENKWKWL